MLEYARAYSNYKLGSGCQQHSNNRSSMMYGSDLGFICYTCIHELRMKSGSEFQEYISAHCLLQINSSISCFLSSRQIEHDE
jgi:hypothetical protein